MYKNLQQQQKENKDNLKYKAIYISMRKPSLQQQFLSVEYKWK